MEITSEDKQAKVEEFLETAPDHSDDDSLWIGLRKVECWVWNSDTPMCNPNWESEPDDDSGGKNN